MHICKCAHACMHACLPCVCVRAIIRACALESMHACLCACMRAIIDEIVTTPLDVQKAPDPNGPVPSKAPFPSGLEERSGMVHRSDVVLVQPVVPHEIEANRAEIETSCAPK